MVAVTAIFAGVGTAHAMKSCTCPDGQMEVVCAADKTRCKLKCTDGSAPTCVDL